MGKMKEAALKVNAKSPVMENHTKLTCDELIAKYPQGVTVIAVDILTGKNGQPYPVFNFREDETAFFAGGSLAMQVVTNWMEICGGDIDAVNAGLIDDGGVFMRFYKSKTKNGNNIVKIDF